jgi:hypothetical protein
MSIGLARGRFFAAEIGDAQRMEYLLLGGPIPRAMTAETKAEPEEVCVAPGLETLLSADFRLRPAPDGHFVVIDDFGEALDDTNSHPSSRRGAATAGVEQVAAAVIQTRTKRRHRGTPAPFFARLRNSSSPPRGRQFTGEHRTSHVRNLRGTSRC